MVCYIHTYVLYVQELVVASRFRGGTIPHALHATNDSQVYALYAVNERNVTSGFAPHWLHACQLDACT